MKIKLVIPSDLQYLRIIRNLVKDIISGENFMQNTITQIILAIDEACTNVVEHSYKMDNSKKLTISFYCDKEKATFVIVDSGIGMKNLKTKKLDLKKYVEQKKEGGLGRYIIENVMDEVKYTKGSKNNRLKLIKYYDKSR
ncbi:ATP-binding protein [candidate division WOR-3 bacterium]|nr:ATP-binding protein [candidate division WOR-3 bacterium]